MNQAQIFMAFLRVGLLGYGGGPSSIPLIHKEIVERYESMSDEEFSDILAIGNTLPGPIATKMAGYIGYRLAGIPGMLSALIASVLPTVVLMIVLLTSLATFRDKPWVQGMTNGVLPVVAVMMATLTWSFVKRAKKDFGWGITIVLIILTIAITEIANIHPAFVIGALILFALFKKQNPSHEKEGEDTP